MLCCCVPPEILNVTDAINFWTRRYQHDLLDTMQKNNHRLDIDDFYRFYDPDIGRFKGYECTFGSKFSPCSRKDFVPKVTQMGMCYTFNSGADGNVRKAETKEYYLGKYSEGFKVLNTSMNEYINEWEGINVGPGHHVVIALSEKRVILKFLSIEALSPVPLPSTLKVSEHSLRAVYDLCC